MIVQDLCKFQRAFFGLDRICNEKICKFALICKLYLLAQSSVIDSINLRFPVASTVYPVVVLNTQRTCLFPGFYKVRDTGLEQEPLRCQKASPSQLLIWSQCVWASTCAVCTSQLIIETEACTVQFTVSALVGTLVCKAYFPTRGGTLRNMERGIWRHARAWRSTLGICILSGRGRHAYNNLKYIGGTLRSIYCNVAARYVV